MSEENCKICFKEPFRYICPRCDINYCSVACYKSQQHLKCSEAFYKQCIQDELVSSNKKDAGGNEDMRKIYNILKRMHQADAGLETESFEQDGLDSDDENDVENAEDQTNIENNPEESSEFEDDIAERLKNIDINDADEVWERLTMVEQDEFKKLLSTGEIMKLLPDYKPWWLKRKNSKIVEIKNEKDNKQDDATPHIVENIPKFSSICSKDPASCLHYNLWNILAAYSCTVRYFNGEHFTNPNEATAYLVNISSTLKYGTNFEDVEDAVISVEMEALTTGNGASQIMPLSVARKALLVEDRSQLQSDARNLMSNVYNKLAALSDILRLLQHTNILLKAPNNGRAEFQKLFALSSGMEELTRTKIKILIKKMEFYLSYVNIELESGLK